ncbi:MAG: hypothetical protein RIC35_17370 [Marinoscillum sp.]
MAKESFKWKSLFLNDVESNQVPDTVEQPKTQSKTTNFPPETNIQSKLQNAATGEHVSQKVLNTIMKMYEDGFTSLNKPGYDFYEYFKAIDSVGSNDPQVYKMALTMANTVDKNVTKDMLLTHADYYIFEINKVHDQYQSQGIEKKEQIQKSQKLNKQSLNGEINALEKELVEIQSKIVKKKEQLKSLDTSLIAEISEIDQKITCNTLAKNRVLEAITNVVNGIKNNI